MATALTKTAIEALIARARGQKGPQLELIDDREPGLRFRAGERSTTWSLSVRLKTGEKAGQRTRVTLGAWPGMGIADARKAAQDTRRKIDDGIDPNEEKRAAAKEAARAAKNRRSLADVLDQYDREKLVHLRRRRDVRSALDGSKGLFRDMLRREPASIEKAEIVEAVKRHAKSSPIAANRALAYASAFFSWCVSEDIVASNPAAGIKKPAKENSRDRHHTVDELSEIWEAAGTLGYPFGHIYRLLMALPMRREEIAALPVAELGLGSDNDPSLAVWTLPASRTKNGQALRVPLSPLARSIIAEALHDPCRPVTGTDEVGKEHPNPFLFSMTGLTPASGFGRAKRRLDAAIAAARAKKAEEASAEPVAIPHWTIHDLRTSFTTLACQSLKVPANVADRCLNHVATATTSKIARIYNQDDLFDERRAALNAWANFIETTVLGNKAAIVVPFARAEVA